MNWQRQKYHLQKRHVYTHFFWLLNVRKIYSVLHDEIFDVDSSLKYKNSKNSGTMFACLLNQHVIIALAIFLLQFKCISQKREPISDRSVKSVCTPWSYPKISMTGNLFADFITPEMTCCNSKVTRYTFFANVYNI